MYSGNSRKVDFSSLTRVLSLWYSLKPCQYFQFHWVTASYWHQTASSFHYAQPLWSALFQPLWLNDFIQACKVKPCVETLLSHVHVVVRLHSQTVWDTFLTQEPELLVTNTCQVWEAAKVHIISFVKHHKQTLHLAVSTVLLCVIVLVDFEQ